MTLDVAATPSAEAVTVAPVVSSGETEMLSACEPVGVTEVAIYLKVRHQTVHQWLFRTAAKEIAVPMPPPDWVVNGQEAWNLRTIKGWAIAAGRLDPSDVDRYDADWAKAKAEGRVMSRRQLSALERQEKAQNANGKPAAKKRTRKAT